MLVDVVEEINQANKLLNIIRSYLSKHINIIKKNKNDRGNMFCEMILEFKLKNYKFQCIKCNNTYRLKTKRHWYSPWNRILLSDTDASQLFYEILSIYEMNTTIEKRNNEQNFLDKIIQELDDDIK